MFVSADKKLAHHRAEIVRLRECLSKAQQNSRVAGLLRATLQLHEDILAQSDEGAARKA